MLAFEFSLGGKKDFDPVNKSVEMGVKLMAMAAWVLITTLAVG